MYNPNLPQYSFGSWLKGNAGTIGTVAGAGLGIGLTALTGGLAAPALPAIMGLGSQIGGQIGGAVQEDFQQGEAADAQAQQFAHQKKLGLAQNQLNQSQNQNFQGTQSFQNGGGLGSIKEVDYNTTFPQKTSDGQEFYITRRTNDTMNNPAFTPLGDSFSAYTNPDLIPDFGNVRGYSFDENTNKFNFNAADRGGSPDLFRNIFENKVSSQELQLPQLNQKANGGPLGNLGSNNTQGGLEEYSGQSHNGPNGGVPVSASGSPASITEEQPTGLVENGENSFTFKDGQVYIFSDKLKL
jgi:hypothetical protein